jgi:uncharacterized membrane protein YciS (DUF1049 family)
MKLDLKTIATLLGVLALVGGWVIHFGGFYYTTQLRLDNIEESISHLEKKVNRAHKSKGKHQSGNK